MKKFGVILTLVLALLLTFNGVATAAPPEQLDVIIGFNQLPGSSEQELVRGFGGEIIHTFSVIPAIAATIPETAIQGLLRNPRVSIIEPDITIKATDDTVPWGIARIGADVVHQSGIKGSGVKIAILDTGIDYRHPDLAPLYAGGYDFVNNDTNPMDDNGHGTHVAGTIAAVYDNNGVVGVAPEVELYALKVLDRNGYGSSINIAIALEWATGGSTLPGSIRVDITNNSYGSLMDLGIFVETAFSLAYDWDGVLNIAAAGNSGNSDGTGDNVEYPGKYDTVIAVAATDQSDTRADFSSTGPTVELAAPGVDILSTYLRRSYAWGSGTSMASPHVVGTAALIMSSPEASPRDANSDGIHETNGDGIWSNEEVRALLKATADDLDVAGKDNLYGYGLVDADEAVQLNTGVPDVSITNPTDGVTYHVNEPISFIGTAIDPEDGDITPSLIWTSNIDSHIGTGGSFLTTLTEGIHTITASATDSEGNMGNSYISVTVLNDAPVVSISQPWDGSIFDSGVSVNFAGTASDTEDGDVTASMIWTSSIDGQIGTGESFSTVLSDGIHTITAKATDGNGKTGNSFISTTIGTPIEVTSVSVSTITYNTEGGKNGDRHLTVTLTLVNNLGDNVAGASLSIEVILNGTPHFTGTGITGTDGTVSFKLPNAPSGFYTTDVTNVIADSLSWDGSTPVNYYIK